MRSSTCFHWNEKADYVSGSGAGTAIQALFFRLPIDTPWNPNKEGEPFLVWGGATSVGLCASAPPCSRVILLTGSMHRRYPASQACRLHRCHHGKRE